MKDDIADRFSSHKVNEKGRILIDQTKLNFYALAQDINKILPDSREKSIVLTKLEEASFMAVAGISRTYNDE